MSDDYFLKNPATHKSRVVSDKLKNFHSTGIPPHKIDIKKLTMSNKNTPLAWITFGNAKIVQDIFRLSVQNGKEKELNAFPNIPGKAMARNNKIIEILKELQ